MDEIKVVKVGGYRYVESFHSQFNNSEVEYKLTQELLKAKMKWELGEINEALEIIKNSKLVTLSSSTKGSSSNE